MIAHAPATCGAAIDVPSSISNSPPGIDETMPSPGASSDKNGEMFENHATSSVKLTAPTLIALGTHAGDERLVGSALLPAATIVATPIARRLSIAGLNGSVSQGASNDPP